MKALILDSGGVLVRPDAQLIADHARQLGIVVTPDKAIWAIHAADRRRDVGTDTGRPFAHYWAENVGCAPELGTALWDQVLSNVPAVDLWSIANEEARELLTKLDVGVPRYVVTNSEGDAHHELGRCGLRDLVTGVLDSTQLGISKPDQRIFHMAAVAMDVLMTECVYVSDTLDAPTNLPAAKVLYDPFDLYLDAGPLPGWTRIKKLTELLPLMHRSDPALGAI